MTCSAVRRTVVRSRGVALIALALMASWSASLSGERVAAGAQRGRGGPPPTPPTAQAGAPIDLTGYWVSVVTEDWRYRMVTPKKGDFASVPLNDEGRKIVEAWDPAKDVASGNECKAYGAAGIMRVPGRVHLTWQDDTTLKIGDVGNRWRPAARRRRWWRRWRRHHGSRRRSRRRRARRTAGAAARRITQGRHDPFKGWIPAEERRALQ